MSEGLFTPGLPGEWDARVEVSDFGRVLRLGLFRSGAAVGVDYAFQMAPVEVGQGEVAPELARLRADEGRAMLQSIVDAAWQTGIKPKASEDFARENATQRRHLEDMRALVGKMAKVDLP